MSVSTRRGDDGTTGLFHGPRVSKAHPRVCTGGTLDELGAHLGFARAVLGDDLLQARLEALLRDLFLVSAELGTPPERRDRLKERLSDAHLATLDAQVAELEAVEGLLDGWSLPGGSVPGSALDLARTICRRAEREVVALTEAGEEDHPLLLRWLNRASDLLWLYGRWYELRQGVDSALRADRGWK